MPDIELRERGIYRLPDRREFIICATGDGNGYVLYRPETWRRYGLAEYRMQANGRVLSRGLVVNWRAEDLKDTGRTASELQTLKAG
jgi:hypothetical protein